MAGGSSLRAAGAGIMGSSTGMVTQHGGGGAHRQTGGFSNGGSNFG